MKSIYENVSENETTVSIIKSELNLSKDIVRNIIKRIRIRQEKRFKNSVIPGFPSPWKMLFNVVPR